MRASCLTLVGDLPCDFEEEGFVDIALCCHSDFWLCLYGEVGTNEKRGGEWKKGNKMVESSERMKGRGGREGKEEEREKREKRRKDETWFLFCLVLPRGNLEADGTYVWWGVWCLLLVDAFDHDDSRHPRSSIYLHSPPFKFLYSLLSHSSFLSLILVPLHGIPLLFLSLFPSLPLFYSHKHTAEIRSWLDLLCLDHHVTSPFYPISPSFYPCVLLPLVLCSQVKQKGMFAVNCDKDK